MYKTFSITREHTVLSRIVVKGDTEEEAMANYYEDNYIDTEEVDVYDWEVVGIEEDVPQ